MALAPLAAGSTRDSGLLGTGAAGLLSARCATAAAVAVEVDLRAPTASSDSAKNQDGRNPTQNYPGGVASYLSTSVLLFIERHALFSAVPATWLVVLIVT